MRDQAAGLRLVQLWLGTGAELTHQDGYGAPVARVDDLRMWLVVSFCSAALAHRHTQWASLITGLRPLGVFSRAQQSSLHATAGCVVREGRTALALAAVAGHSPVVALLIDAGADLNVKSIEG